MGGGFVVYQSNDSIVGVDCIGWGVGGMRKAARWERLFCLKLLEGYYFFAINLDRINFCFNFRYKGGMYDYFYLIPIS